MVRPRTELPSDQFSESGLLALSQLLELGYRNRKQNPSFYPSTWERCLIGDEASHFLLVGLRQSSPRQNDDREPEGSFAWVLNRSSQARRCYFGSALGDELPQNPVIARGSISNLGGSGEVGLKRSRAAFAPF